jgi:transcriptional antiterminator NusG
MEQFHPGDRIKVVDGTFLGHEGRVVDVRLRYSLVRVEITIFGRTVPVELEFSQIQKIPDNN